MKKNDVRLMPISNGTVLDHLPVGAALKIIEILGLDKPKDTVTVAINTESRRMGRKDLVFIEGKALSKEEIEKIALIAAGGTMNIIKNKEIKKKVEAILFAPTKQEAVDNLKDLESYAQEHQKYAKLKKLIGVLKRNFELLLTHFDNPEMSPYNNTLEGFNYIVKRKTNLMKGFKKPVNIGRWIKLIMLDWRFHKLTESTFKERKNKSPLELSSCNLPKIYNWMKYIRKNFSNPPT